MQRLDLKYVFNAPIEKVMDAYAKYDMIGDPECPVKSCKITKRRKDGKIFETAEFSALDEIPEILKPVLKPEMIKWYQYTITDTTEQKYEVVAPYFKNVFRMEGKINYKEIGKNKTEQHHTAELDIKIPMLGPVAEKIIIKRIKEESDRIYKRIKKEIE